MFLLFPVRAGAQDSDHNKKTKNILIINSYHPDYIWSDNEQQGVMEVLRRNAPEGQIYVEFMDTKHHAGQAYLEAFQRFFRQKYRTMKIDVIIALDNPALDFILEHRKAFLTDVPVVFCGINDYQAGMLRGQKDVTGIAQDIDPSGTMDLMLKLHPQTKEIFVVNDYTVTGLSFRKEIESILPQFSGRVRIRFNNNVSIKTLMDDIRELAPGQLILLQSFAADNAGRVFDQRQIAKLLASQASVPIYGVHEEGLGYGIVGGRLLSGKRHGADAAAVVIRILSGEKPSDIPVVTESGVQNMFDENALKRFKIEPAALPPESVMINRQVSFFATHKKVIIMAAQIIVVLCLVIGLLAFNIVQRKRAAAVLRKSEKQFRLLADNAPDAIFILTNEKFAYVNEAFCSLVGARAPQDVLGDSIYNRFHPDSHAMLKERIGPLTVERQSAPIMEHRLMKLDNTIVAVEVSSVPFEYQDETGTLVFARDVSERKEAQAALQASEERFRSIIENTDAGYFFVDLTGRLMAVNSAWLRMYGYERKEDVIGRKFIDLQKEDDLDEARAIVREVIRDETGYRSGLFRRKMKNGEIGYHTYSARTVRQEGNVIGVEGFTIDTTALHRAEEALRTSERKFRSLFDSMNEGVGLHELICDDHGHPVDYRLLEANSAFERHTGFSIEKVGGRLSRDVYGGSEPPYLDRYASVALTGEPNYFETYFPLLNKHFSVSVFSPDPGDTLRFATVFQDITGRKTMEAALAAEKERLLVTLRSIGDGVITTDIEGRIVLMNKVAEDLTAWTQDEAAGRPLDDVFCIMSEGARNRCDNPVKRVMATGSIVELPAHSILIARDKTERIIADSAAPIRGRDNNILGIVLVFRDTTGKKRMEDAIRNAEKLEAIGILAGGIAHDFNNLLGGIFGYLEMIKRDADRGDVSHISACVGKALSTYERAKHITQQLLTFSKGGAPVCKVLRLDRLIRESVTFILSGSNISATFCMPQGPSLCNCDENQIGQVIDNVVMNARDSLKDGGRIEVSLELLEADKAPRVLPGGQYFVITIRDNGTGIAKEHLPYIFDPFFTTRPGGSGLGLATSYSIVKKHNGLIEAESELGVGSIFRVYLPRPETVRMSAAKKMEGRAFHKDSGNILIMDDEDFILEVVSAMLKAKGLKPVRAKNSDEALALVREAYRDHKFFSAAILDLTVPGGRGGREMVRDLMEVDPNIMVIAASGYSDDPVMASPSEFGFDAKLVKPFRLADMEEVLREFLQP